VSVSQPSTRDDVIVYRLLDPETLAGAAAEIEGAIVAACPIPPTSPQFALSAQGCVRFMDPAARRHGAGLLPQTDRDAAAIARDFLKRAGAAVRERSGGRISDLFQLSVLEHGATRRVLSRTSGETITG
jgi:hypothetical protein